MDRADQVYCVVGSGPTGVSAAEALLRNGAHVLMIDAGLQLEAQRSAYVESAARKPAHLWTEAERSKLTGDFQPSLLQLPEKKKFGSDYANRALACFPVNTIDASLYLSFAQGGLSNLWGCACAPMIERELADWPISSSDLENHYRAVLDFMPMTGHRDNLERILPLYCEPGEQQISRQAATFLIRAEAKKQRFEALGVFAGASRLAARLHATANAFDCQYCGNCLTGCPYGLLYNSAADIERMCASKRFDYRPGVVAQCFDESDGYTVVHCTDLRGGKLESIRATRLLIAAGGIASARIVLRSLQYTDRPITMLTSDWFQLPALSLYGNGDVTMERLHTMPQVFLEVIPADTDRRAVHFQMYTYNTYFTQALDRLAGPLRRLTRPLVNAIVSRLHLIFGFLHSDHSSRLILSLKGDLEQTLEVRGLRNVNSKLYATEAVQTLGKALRITRMFAFPSTLIVHPPGAPVHLCASFPMRRQPKELECDRLGRLWGFQRVHLVDASVLPSITAHTITLTAMANSHRIASHLRGLET